MKLLASALALGFVLTVGAQNAEARVCRDGMHRAHCVTHRRVAHLHHVHYFHHVHHFRHYGEAGYVVPPPPPPYYPYPFFVVDNPSAPFRNSLQWLMDQENDPPFTSYRRYR
ncbi:MAG: hypothetical protein ACYC5H_10220 [Methylovirgula sp.]